MLSAAARELLASDALAHIATVDPDGGPNVTLAWVGLENDEIVFATMQDQRKLANLRRDPRVVVSIESNTINSWGLREYLVVRGRATVTEGGAAQMLQDLAATYIGPGVRFPDMDDPPAGFVTRIQIERVGGMGSWTDEKETR